MRLDVQLADEWDYHKGAHWYMKVDRLGMYIVTVLVQVVFYTGKLKIYLYKKLSYVIDSIN